MVSQALANSPYEPPVVMPPAPRQIGRFEIRSEIGRGSNGVVYAAFDPVLGREVAIKAIPLAADSQARRRAETGFLQEAKNAASLNHPGIVTVFDAGTTDEAAYIAMERLYGNDLHDCLSTGSKLSTKAIASLMARVADAVHYAHRRGVIHRDLKPSNIFLTRDHKPKVLDFGVALTPYATAAKTPQLIGTPNYMSPEQAQGRELDARSDVFSMGAILYELLTGQRAFEGALVDEILARVAGQPPTPVFELNPDLPAELVQIVQRSLAKNPGDRYQSAAEMRNDLVAVAQEDPGTAAPATQRRVALLNRHSVRLIVAVLAVSLSIIILALERPHRSATAGAAQAAAPLAESAAPAVGPAPGAATAVPGGTANGKSPERLEASARPLTRAIASLPAPVHRAPRAHPKPAAPVLLAQAQRPAPAAAPVNSGTVSLGITPWGEIIVDGSPHGVSPPLTHLTLAPGPHTIEVRNGAEQPFVSHLDVLPGASIELQHRF